MQHCLKTLSAGLIAACAAFSATAALPSGYTQYTYIKGDGSTAKLVTDYTPTPNSDKIEAEISFPSGTLDQSQCIWCARGTSTSTATWTLFVANSSGYKFRFDYGNSGGNWLTPALSATDVKYTVTADGPAFTWSGGNGQTHTQIADYTAGGPLMLFASYYNGTGSNLANYGKHKLYSFKVWRSGTLIHDLVPAVCDSDSKKGLYDITADKFYAGTGTFTMGEEVTVSDRLEITSSVDGIGSPSPAYGKTNGLAAADSFTVSCGASTVADDTGTMLYSCTGWKLYDETNIVVSTGAGTSFTYVHPTPAEYRRLEWQWEVTAYRGTIAAGHGGAVSQSGTGWFAADTPVTVTATPNAGNGFQRWTGTLPEGVSATSASVTFTPTAPFSMTAVFETVGSGGLVFFNEKTSSYWHTATNCVIDLPIEFPAGASSATLSVTGIDYSAQYAIPSGTAQYTLSLPAATSPTAENVYDLALAFNDSASTVRTAKLGLIYGHDATTTGWTRCLAPAGTRAWSKTKGVAVIPIPYGTTFFTIALDGGEATSTDTGLDGAAGWYPLRLKGETTADLAATTLEGSLSASLRGDGAGFFLIVR